MSPDGPSTDGPSSALPVDVPERPLPGDPIGRRQRRPRRSLTYQLLWAVVAALVVGAALVAGALWLDWFTPTVRWVIVGVGLFWLVPVRIVQVVLDWRVFWYAVSPQEIDVCAGVLVRTRTVVPMNRVQHLRVTHGPIADRFTVATVHVHTAAGTVELPDLDAGEADRLRARIAELAGLTDPGDAEPDA